MSATAAESLFAPPEAAPARRLPQGMGVGGSMLAGLLLILAFFGGFGAWAALAPLESAAIAPGLVSVAGKHKTVQHLEGGIVAQILVEEGSRVAAGQPLIRLDETQTRAQLERLENQYHAAAALIARLQAERDGTAAIAWPAWLQDDAAAEPEVRQTLAGQQRIFEARRTSLANQKAILRQRIAQLQEQIAGLEDEIAAQDRQLALIHDEAGSVERLLDKGLEQRPRLLALQRQAAEIEGLRAHNQGAIAQARQGIGEAEMQIEAVGSDQLNKVVEELRDTETTLNDLRERIDAAQDVLRRTTITAPVSGTVVNLQLYTPGGVIEPGKPLMDIVPADQPLEVEARIEPTDIDVVHAGMAAEIRFPAFNQRTTPTLKGTVEQVSADRLVDQRTGQGYYLARVAVDPSEVKQDGLSLYPGMPAEVMIVTGQRTPLEYLLKPLRNSLSRGLRET